MPEPLDLIHVAHLARLDLTADELRRYRSQLADILAYVEKLNALDVSGIEPTAHAAPAFDVMRPDRAGPSLPRSAVLANAPQKTADQFLVPKVVD
ncbi:Asp-tRNA(Asn)/Glu-tRNA(Gln) amidotransferase subunit GatC [soil metagenome]